MRLILILSFLGILIAPLHSQRSVPWTSIYGEALEKSRKEDKLILLNFWTPSNESCRRMDLETWTKDTVIAQMDDFIPTRINLETDSDIAGQFGVRSLPTIMIIDSYGIPLETITGSNSTANLNYVDDTPNAISLSRISRLLNRYPKNIALINQAQRKYNEDKKDIPALFGLAEAYLITSIQAQQSAKTNFLAESKTFLYRTKKLLKKSKNKSLQQRFDLLDLAVGAFRTKAEKGLNKLLDYDKSNNILPENEALFHASTYIGYMNINQKRKAKAVLEKLKNAEDGYYLITHLNIR